MMEHPVYRHCPECHEEPEEAGICKECGLSRCHDCGEWKSDPGDFYDGLRCIMCCEEEDDEDDAD